MKETLRDRLTGKNLAWPFGKEKCLQGIGAGIQHLHSIGYLHNSSNSENVILEQEDRPVIIYFDSCGKEGSEPILKRVTPTWCDEKYDSGYLKMEKDLSGPRKIREYLDDSMTFSGTELKAGWRKGSKGMRQSYDKISECVPCSSKGAFNDRFQALL